MTEVIDVTNVSNSTLFIMLDALRTEHTSLHELYLQERENWFSLETNYLGSEQGKLLNHQCCELVRVIEQLSRILNERNN